MRLGFSLAINRLSFTFAQTDLFGCTDLLIDGPRDRLQRLRVHRHGEDQLKNANGSSEIETLSVTSSTTIAFGFMCPTFALFQ